MADKAIRLSCRWEGRKVSLVASQRIEMLTQASDDEQDVKGRVGNWLEVRDAQEQVLYLQILHDPIALEVEAPPASLFEGDGGGQAPDEGIGQDSWTRAKTDASSGYIDFIVPEIGSATHVVLVESAVDPSTERLAQQDLFRISIATDKEG